MYSSVKSSTVRKKDLSSTADRTRQTFILVARQLFADFGFQGTTMNAIAEGAGKGRRTLYTYFTTKREVYLAVIQQEFQRLYEELESFVDQPLRPLEKLMQYIARRQTAVYEVVKWNGSLEAEFFNDIATVEHARIRFDVLERRLIQRILREGMEDGSFRHIDTKRTAMLLHACMKGLEVPFIRGHLGRSELDVLQTYRVVKSIIMHGISK